MARMLKRTKDLAGRVEAVDTTALRARILDAVEEAIDRAEAALQDAPRPAEVAVVARDGAMRMRRSQAVETAVTALGASMPIIVGALRSRMTARNAGRVARMTPLVLRTHPVLFGAAVAGGALIGVAYLRSQRAGGSGESPLGSAHERPEERAVAFDLEEEVARMEDEGGDLGAYDALEPTAGRATAVTGSSGSGDAR